MNRARWLAASIAGSARVGILHEVVLVGAAILAYFGIRNVTAGSPDEAFANARDVVRMEDVLGIDWEGSIQGAVVGTDELVTLANWIYIWGHWPVILGTAIALYLVRRDRYYVLRNALFVSGAIGFLFFAFFPVAPPRLLGLGLVDTVTEQSEAYRALQPPGLTNQYAAFPSLHLGWNVAVGIVLLATTTHLAVRALAVASPVAMCFAVVATANHFVLDVLAGVVVVAVGLVVAWEIHARQAPATLVGRGSGSSLPFRGSDATAVRRRPPRGQPHRRSPRRGVARHPARRG